MKLNALTTLAQVEAFLAGTQPVTFSVLSTKDECYQWIQTNLLTFEYLTLSKPQKGIVICYLVPERKLDVRSLMRGFLPFLFRIFCLPCAKSLKTAGMLCRMPHHSPHLPGEFRPCGSVLNGS